jgi:hypothetical protein
MTIRLGLIWIEARPILALLLPLTRMEIDDTLIFSCTGGSLKIKNLAGRTTHKDIGLNKQHMKSPVVTSG